MLQRLFCLSNWLSRDIAEGEPWNFTPKQEDLTYLIGLPKSEQRKALVDPSATWPAYTAAKGASSNERVSVNNPAIATRAFIADYDKEATFETVRSYMEQVDPALRPTFMEMSLNGKWHAIWIFESEINVTDENFLKAFNERLGRLLKVERMMAGFDDASYRGTQIWSQGRAWYSVNSEPLSLSHLTGIAIDTLRATDTDTSFVPLSIIAEEVQKRFPGRWQGEFVEGAVGVRFWDQKADNERGAYVCKHGCYCLTGPQPFVTWDEIFGRQWVDQQRILQLGKAAEGCYFDHRKYWIRLESGLYVEKSREDTLLHFSIKSGLSRKPGKSAASDAEKVLKYVQDYNYVDGVLPLVYRPPGVYVVKTQKILNVSRVRALEPAKGIVTPDDFPFLYPLIWNLFARAELGSRDSIIAWVKRSYETALDGGMEPGQAIFLCGPAGVGKTFFCDHVIVPLLGGEQADPYSYFIHADKFSSDLFKAGVLAMNDKAPVTDDRSRERLTQSIKSFVANETHTYEAKFKDRVSIEWVGRLVVTLNDDAKSLGILPELNANTEDKVMFFACERPNVQWGTRAENVRRAKHDLPFLARWLIQQKYPEHIIELGSRSYIKSFHDPRIVQLAKQQEFSYNLYELLKEWQRIGAYWNDEGTKRTEWVGTATELFNNLADCCGSVMKEWDVRRMAKSLQALERSRDAEVESVGTAKDRLFKIKRFQPL